MHIHHLIFRQHYQRLNPKLQTLYRLTLDDMITALPLTCLGSAHNGVCWALLNRGETRTEFLRLPVNGTVLVDAI